MSSSSSSTTPTTNSGMERAADLTMNLLKSAHAHTLTDIENLCKNALVAAGQETQITNFLSSTAVEKKMPDIEPGLTQAQTRNFCHRFGYQESLMHHHKHSWFSKKFTPNTAEPRIYEDVIDPAVLNAPITDICIVQKSDPIPDGFYRLSRSLTNRKATLNYKSGGNEIYLCVKKDNAVNAPFVTSIIVIYPDKNELYPPGYQVVRRGNQACNVNIGTSAERIFVCYKRERSGNPISDLVILFPGKSELPPPNFFHLESSPSGIPANLNAGTGGGRVYLCYRQLFQELICLENEPGTPNGQGVVPVHGSPKITAMKKLSSSQYGMSTMVGYPSTREANAGAGADAGAGTARTASADDNTPLLDMGAASPNPLDRTESLEDPTAPGSIDSARQVTNPIATIRTLSDGPIQINDSSLRVRAGLSPRLPSDDDVELDDPIPGFEEEDSANTEVDRRIALVTSSDGTLLPRLPRLLMHALLAGIYVRQQNVSIDIINGVLSLLNNSDFFKSDLSRIANPNVVTLLDLTVQAICDRLEICQKVELPLLLDFMLSILKKSKGKLSQPIIRRLFNSLTMLMTFHTGQSRWQVYSQSGPCQPDGSGFQECSVMEEMLKLIVKQVENEEIAVNRTATPRGQDDIDDLEDEAFVEALVTEFTDDVIDSVEICKLCDLAQGVVASQNAAVTSHYFWRKTHTIARILYSDDANRNSFTVLCALCRLAWPAIVITESGTTSIRELGTKLLALDMLVNFCGHSGDIMTSSKLNGYMIRRLVVPCILNNIGFSLREPRVFSKIMKLISTLWITWRVHLRIEFANLCEQLCIRILQASVVKVRPVYQMTVLTEMEIWFAQPHLILEMFVNFDMDDKFVSHWNIFSHLVRAMCTISKRPDYVSGLSSRVAFKESDHSYEAQMERNSVSVREVNMKSLEQVAHVAKTLMDATGHAFFMTEDSHFRTRSVTIGAGWEQELEDDEFADLNLAAASAAALGATSPSTSVITKTSSNLSSIVEEDANSVISPSPVSSPMPTPTPTPTPSHPDHLRTSSPYPSMGPPRPDTAPPASGVNFSDPNNSAEKGQESAEFKFRAKRRMSRVGLIKQQHQKAEELIAEAVRIYEQHSSLKKALKHLINKNFIANTPAEIAGFLRVYKNSFDPSAIGDYLGEGGVNDAEKEFYTQIRYRYTRAISFVEMELEPALRLYLTGCGFRLPGEAQKIDRFVETFQITYWADNHGTQNCPLKHPDTVHILTFAIIMLNTDLHRANATGPKGKKRAKMTKEEFINNLRGSDKGDNIDRDYLSRIYDNIAVQPIELAVSASETEGGGKGALSSATGGVGVTLAGAGAGGGQGAATAAPVLEFSVTGERVLVTEISRNVRDSEDLLRSLSQRTYPFSRTTNFSKELVSFMFESVWLYFRELTESLLDDSSPTSSSTLTLLAVDVLNWSLTSSIFLGLNMERRVLAERLEKFQQHCVQMSETAKAPGHPLQDTKWATKVVSCNKSTTVETIAEIHKMVAVLKEVIQETENFEISKGVASKIEKKAKVLEKNTFFVREGPLKKQNRNGRVDPYHVFLFSDTLLYCHQAMLSGEYIVHEQLPLAEMSVSDNRDDDSECSIYIQHPIKSFFLYAETPELKRAWYRDLQATISSCKRRAQSAHQKQSQRKFSVMDRIEEQKKTIEATSAGGSTRKIKFMEDLQAEPMSTNRSSNPPETPRTHNAVLLASMQLNETASEGNQSEDNTRTRTSTEDDDVLRLEDIDMNPLIKDNGDAASQASSDTEEPHLRPQSFRVPPPSQSNGMSAAATAALLSQSLEDPPLSPNRGKASGIYNSTFADGVHSPSAKNRTATTSSASAAVATPDSESSVLSTPSSENNHLLSSHNNNRSSSSSNANVIINRDQSTTPISSPLFEYDV